MTKSDEGGPTAPPREGLAARALALVPLALVLTAAILRAGPPAPRGLDAPASEFSARRAERARDAVLADGAPRVAGSAAHREARERLLAALRAAGVRYELDAGWSCGPWAACAPVVNVLALAHDGRGALGGEEAPEGAVLLAAHYDSVGAGPGASDDGAGVAAALEALRALRAEPATGAASEPYGARPVWVLWTDGEEPGLLGMQRFVAMSPRARAVHAAVNLDARGTEGAALLFEVAGDEAAAARYIARARRPASASAYVAIYRAMPNDTDFSVLRDRGVPGANLAFVEGGTRYHTPRDDRAHAHPGTLQQLGDAALALVRGYRAEAPRRGDRAGAPWPWTSGAHWLDLAGLAVLRWPAAATRWLALASALALAFATRRALQGRGLAGRALLAAAGGALAGLALSLAGAGALGLAGSWAGARPAPFVAHSARLAVAVALLASAGALAGAALGAARGARSSARARALVAWGLWSLAALALALAAPGVTPTLLVAVLVAALVALGSLARERWSTGARAAGLAAPALVGAVTLAPSLRVLHEVVGVALPLALAPVPWLLALLCAPLVPARALRRAALAFGLAALGVSAWWLASPTYTADAPQRVNLRRVTSLAGTEPRERDCAQTTWEGYDFGVVPAGLRAALGPGYARDRADAVPGEVAPYACGAERAATDDTARAGPSWALEGAEALGSQGLRRVRLRLRVGVAGASAGLWFDAATAPRVRSLRLEGVEVPWPSRAARGPWRGFEALAVPAEGVLVEVALTGDAPVAGALVQRAAWTPDEALRRARGPLAAPSQEGDERLWIAPLRW